MNIDRAIANKSYVFQGPKGFKPIAPHARFFAVSINDKTGTGYEVLNIVFNNGACWGAHYAMTSPKNEPFAKRFLCSRQLLDVSDQFKNEVASNQSLKQIVTDWIVKCRNTDPEGMTQKNMEALNNISFSRQQATMDRIADDAAREDRINKACEYAKRKAGNREYRYYREYYVSGRIPHDDDYEGSGGCSIEQIVRNMGYVDPAKIDQLIADMDNGHTIVDTEDHYRTFYGMVNKSKGNAGQGTLNENKKVTLTIGQIKRLILETGEELEKVEKKTPDNAELIREEYRNPFKLNITFDQFKEMVRSWDRRPFKKNASVLGEFSDNDGNITLNFAKFSRAIPDENVRIFLVHDKQDSKTTIIAADNPGSLGFELENLFDIGDMTDQAKQIYSILADTGDVAYPIEPGKWKFGEAEDYKNADVAIRRMR